MTRKATLDEYLSKRQSKIGKTKTGLEAVFKGFAAPPAFRKEDRSAQFVMSSERIDRDGDIVRTKGIELDAFNANPQGLLFHSSRDWPIGQWKDVTKRLRTDPPRLEGTLEFAPEGGPIPEIDQAFWAVENGLIRTVSIGFMPLDLEVIEHEEGTSAWSWGYLINASELYECSLVSLPAQPDAMAKGMIACGELAAAKDFLEQAHDEWAKDPRTSMFVPRKELEETYKRFFGKEALTVMALDTIVKPEEAALSKVAKIFEERGIKAAAGGSDDGVDSVSGIQITIAINTGDTGANTRTGTDVGDAGAGATDGNPNLAQLDASAGTTKDEEPPAEAPPESAPKRRTLFDALWQRMFGAEEPSTPEPKAPVETAPQASNNNESVPGSFERRRSAIDDLERRLQAVR